MSDLSSKGFPDIPPQVNQFITHIDQYVMGTLTDSNVVVNDLISLSTLINSLHVYQSKIISGTPEFTDPTTATTFLKSISTTSGQSSTLVTQLDILSTNIQNAQAKLGGNFSPILFYTYSTATIILGLLCIMLVAYIVYTYVIVDISSGSGSYRGGRRIIHS
jgi:hypothetical protein